MSPELAIIIVNWNGKQYLYDCLSSIFTQNYGKIKVVLVDNNSADDSISFVRSQFPKVNIVTLTKNYGFSKGNNIGIKYSFERDNPDYFFLLNNDTKLVQSDGISKLINIAEQDDKIGILGCKLIYPDAKIQYLGMKLKVSSEWGVDDMELAEIGTQDPYEVYAAVGAAFLIKKKVVDVIGMLDEGYSPFYYEETDYCVRARTCGYLTKMTCSVQVIHYRGPSTNRLPRELIDYARNKNRLRFILLNYPLLLLPLRILYEIQDMIKKIVRGVIKRKDKSQSRMPWNISIRNDWRVNIASILKPYLINAKNLKEIFNKRKNRTYKLWY